MYMIYSITIEETISQEFKINASSMEEAMNTAEEKYNSGEFILAPGALVAKQMCAENESGTEVSEWIEF